MRSRIGGREGTNFKKIFFSSPPFFTRIIFSMNAIPPRTNRKPAFTRRHSAAHTGSLRYTSLPYCPLDILAASEQKNHEGPLNPPVRYIHRAAGENGFQARCAAYATPGGIRAKRQRPGCSLIGTPMAAAGRIRVVSPYMPAPRYFRAPHVRDGTVARGQQSDPPGTSLADAL